MNRRFKTYVFVWLILFFVFNVICFVISKEVTRISKPGGAFWFGYIFISAAFVCQLICTYIALKADDITKLFYNIPIICISYTALLMTMIFSVICMVIPNMPNWVVVVVCLLVMSFFAIAVINAKTSSDIVEKVDNKIKEQTFFIKSLTLKAESLIVNAKTDDVKAVCKKVYEALRYSEPKSVSSLADADLKIKERFDVFAEAVINRKSEEVKVIADELVVLIDDRNKKIQIQQL